MVACGFAAIGAGWRIVARTLDVSLQIPAVVSGGLGGLTLVLIGTAFSNIQLDRRAAHRESRETEALLDELAALVSAFEREWKR
jgi:hypothetical protein